MGGSVPGLCMELLQPVMSTLVQVLMHNMVGTGMWGRGLLAGMGSDKLLGCLTIDDTVLTCSVLKSTEPFFAGSRWEVITSWRTQTGPVEPV